MRGIFFLSFSFDPSANRFLTNNFSASDNQPRTSSRGGGAGGGGEDINGAVNIPVLSNRKGKYKNKF